MPFTPARDASPELLYRGRPPQHMHDLEAFMNHVVRLGTSDLTIQTGERAIAKIHGVPHAVTSYAWNANMVDDLARVIVNGQEIKSRLAGGDDYDAAFYVTDAQHTNEHGVPLRQRFRLNATAILGTSSDAKQMVLRHIPAVPPTLEQVDFPDELVDEFAVQQGAFLIAGETGSGKSSTFAACLRHILEGHTAIQGNLVTFESPIEYVFGDIASPCCIVAQSEIGPNVKSYEAGVRGAMRRDPSLILIQEIRDPETINAAADAAITGHPVFSTVHANDSSFIIARMVGQYALNAQAQAFAGIASVVRLLMSQTLVPALDAEGHPSGRACLRDWCIVDPRRSQELAQAGQMGHIALLRGWMEAGDRARSMQRSITDLLEAGRIARATANAALKRYGYPLIEDET